MFYILIQGTLPVEAERKGEIIINKIVEDWKKINVYDTISFKYTNASSVGFNAKVFTIF